MIKVPCWFFKGVSSNPGYWGSLRILTLDMWGNFQMSCLTLLVYVVMSFGFPSIVYCKDLFPFRTLDDPIKNGTTYQKITLYNWMFESSTSPPPPSKPLPLKPPLSPLVAFTSGFVFFQPKGRLRMPSVINSVTASWPWAPSLEASLVPLASVAWSIRGWNGWMDGRVGMGLGWLQPWVWWNFHHHPLPKNKLRKLIVSRERESWKPFFGGGWGGVLS